MSPRLQRYLIYTPASAIATFLVFCSAAIVLYPGCTIEVIGYTSNQYSFTHNFLSALGSMQSNTDNINLDIPRLDNTPSMLLFNSAMVFIGFSVSIFYAVSIELINLLLVHLVDDLVEFDFYFIDL